LSSCVVDYKDFNGHSEITPISGGSGSRSQKPSFFNVFLDFLPNTRVNNATQARERMEERKIMLAQLLERLRAESEAKQHELLYKLINQNDDEKPYDIFGKCLDIARRIMRGERVSAEEMRFLSRYFPELLFQALLLKQEDNDQDECENLSEVTAEMKTVF